MDILVDILQELPEAIFFIKLTSSPSYKLFYSPFTKAWLLSTQASYSHSTQTQLKKLLSMLEVAPLDNILLRKAIILSRAYSLPLHEAVLSATSLHLQARIVTLQPERYNSIEAVKTFRPY